ncbi:TonB-dependent receptor [Rhodanobacter sp. L36]|uniref:TonB-dependent receptor n=1 Tax=Rhodanobacter sp. L36 TaxID=1747221 RepID=UPI00131DEC82|nr:TonB-dependent receptor [Rhodanobacter sp. L36]
MNVRHRHPSRTPMFPRALACAALFIAAHAHASTNDIASTDAPASAASASTLAAVQVDGHYNNGVGTSNAASQGVIMGTLLQDIPILRPGEVLEAIPGLVVTQHSGEGKANQYFLRGYNLDHGTDFTSSVDGVQVNMPTNGHGQGYSDINFLIPELVDHIDYRKGPYFAQTGDFSSAGSADVQYRDAFSAPLLNLTIGSDGYKRGLFAGSLPLSHAEKGPVLLMAFEAMKEDGPWQHPDDMHKLNGLLRLSGGDAQRGWSVDALAYAAHWNSTDQVPLSLIQSGALCRFCALDPTDGGRTAREILSGEFHHSDDSGYLRASAFAEHYRLQLWSDFTYFEDDPVHGDQFNQRDARNIFGSKVAKGWTHTLFGKDSVTEVGAQIRHDQIHVSLLDSQARVAFHTVSSDLVSETEAGVYIENTTIWSSWFRSLVGVRGDAIDLGLRSNVYAPNNGSVSDNRVSPKLSMIFGPWDSTEFFFNIGNGFHSNDARGVVNQFDAVTGQPITRAPALVGSFGKEIGVRTEIVPGLQSSLALWRLDSSSELVYGADAGGTEINGASKRYGVEWNNHMIINEWLLFDADLAWTHARYAHENENDAIGDRIPNAVGKVASVGLTAHHMGPWSADVKMLYIGGYPLSQDGNLRAPSSIVTNLRVQREINPHLSLSLDVLNAFDRKYFDIAYEQDYQVSPTSPLVPDGITVHPGEPREVRLTVSLKM